MVFVEIRWGILWNGIPPAVVINKERQRHDCAKKITRNSLGFHNDTLARNIIHDPGSRFRLFSLPSPINMHRHETGVFLATTPAPRAGRSAPPSEEERGGEGDRKSCRATSLSSVRANCRSLGTSSIITREERERGGGDRGKRFELRAHCGFFETSSIITREERERGGRRRGRTENLPGNATPELRTHCGPKAPFVASGAQSYPIQGLVVFFFTVRFPSLLQRGAQILRATELPLLRVTKRYRVLTLFSLVRGDPPVVACSPPGFLGSVWGPGLLQSLSRSLIAAHGLSSLSY